MDVEGSRKDVISTCYVQVKITLVPGVYVVPEVGLVDWNKNAVGVNLGQTHYYGAKWQIDF